MTIRNQDRPTEGAAGMAGEQRRRRPTPPRSGPDRSPTLGAAPVDGAARHAEVDASAPHGADAFVIGAAVRAAYQVVEQNIQEGRNAAERLRAAGAPFAEPPQSARAVASRLMHKTRDIGATWVDLMVAVLKETDVRAILDRLAIQDRPRADLPAARQSGAPVTHRVNSRRPIEVTLSALSPLSSSHPPTTAGLHALDRATPPLVGVLFGFRPGGGLELRIDVDDDQPAGAYVGAVVDVESQQPIGTLAVKVLG